MSVQKSGIQTTFGKAFEYACVYAIYDKYKGTQQIIIENTPQMRTAKNCFDTAGEKQIDFMDAANAAVRIITPLEPRLEYPDNDSPLILSVQTDAAGISGDVRDVLCIRRGHRWEIGLSCKHNNHAVKHSRLSETIDFGKEWFGYPCSQTYFSEVVPKFAQLRKLCDDSKKAGIPALWSDLPDKAGDYYVPILQSFMDELIRLSKTHSDIPERLIRYLIGRHDFYKIITDDRHRLTRVEAINIAGALNASSGFHKPITTAPVLKTPSVFYHVGFKEIERLKSQNTISIICDNGWEISMRLHNASSKIEPSLKFDVQLISFPSSLFAQIEPWDAVIQ